MQVVQDSTAINVMGGASAAEPGPAISSTYAEFRVIRRNGAVVGFEPSKIAVAMTKAFLAVNGGPAAASARIRDVVAQLTESVVAAFRRRYPQGGTLHIEDIQDQVELALMRSSEHDVARSYVLYREERSRARAQEKVARDKAGATPALHVVENGERRALDVEALRRQVEAACEGDPDAIPVVAYRQNGQPWRVVLKLSDFLPLMAGELRSEQGVDTISTQ